MQDFKRINQQMEGRRSVSGCTLSLSTCEVLAPCRLLGSLQAVHAQDQRRETIRRSHDYHTQHGRKESLNQHWQDLTHRRARKQTLDLLGRR